MANRPGRSSSIPIPRNPSTASSTRNIESVISIPTTSPSRPRLSSTQGLAGRSVATDATRSVSTSYRSIHDPLSVSISPTRMLSRSTTLSSSHPAHQSGRPIVTFVPRIVTATSDASRSTDTPTCAPSHSPTSARRPSAAGARSVSAQRQGGPSLPPLPYSTPISFPRPAYLDYSAFRNMLVTESPSPISAAPSTQKKVEPVSSRNSLSYIHAMTPSTDSDEDESPSPPPTRDSQSVPPVIPQEQVTFPLPTRWSDQERLNSISVSHDGRDLSLNGTTTNNDKEAGANARANHPVPPACGIYYYEVEVRCKEQRSHISIGFASSSFKFSRLPGWDAQSWGYYGDDGHTYETGRTAPFSQTFGSGDIIGCGIDFTTHKMFYTKNKTFLGHVFDGVGKEGNLYPVVGLRYPGDGVRVNFGHEPFRFDIEDHVQQRRNTTWANIMKTPLDPTLLRGRYGKNAIKNLISTVESPTPLTEDESKTVLNQLVLSYLIHHGYAKTAREFQKQNQKRSEKEKESVMGEVDVDMVLRTEDEETDELNDFEGDIERRTAIIDALIRGDVDSAMEGTRKHYPGVFAEDDLLLFKLRCRKLVELILDTHEIKKRMSNGKEREHSPIPHPSGIHYIMDDDGMDMDIDDNIPSHESPINPPIATLYPIDGRARSNSKSPGPDRGSRPTPADLEAALQKAITYGQNFHNDCKLDKRPELKHMFEQASSVIAWNNPFEANDAAEVTGPDARIALANELNEAILKSQGRPTRPTLETVYKHTATCLLQLGVMGTGAAVYADMPRELLES